MDFDINNVLTTLQGDAELTRKTLVALKDTEQGKELLSGFADQYAAERIKANTKETYTRIDALLSEAGFEKQAGEKTSDYLTRFATSFKDLSGKKGSTAREKELQQQLEALKNDGSHNAHWKQTHEEATNKWQAEKNQLMQQICKRSKDLRLNKRK